LIGFKNFIKLVKNSTKMQSHPDPFVIRAPCLQRYINSIFTFSLKNPAIENALNDGSEESAFMHQLNIPEHRGGPTPDFQTQDLDLVARTILKTIRMVSQFPEIYEKIVTLCITTTVWSAQQPSQSSLLRTLEISGLNTQFNIVAKKIAGLDVEPCAVFTHPPINQYHKDSIFVLFSVQLR
jgi:hypothetical protein